MIAQLRALHAACFAGRQIPGRQPTTPAFLASGRSIRAVASTQPIRSASDHRSSGRSKSLKTIHRDGADENERKAFASRPSGFRSPGVSDGGSTIKSEYRQRNFQGGVGESSHLRQSSNPRKEYKTNGTTFNASRRDTFRNSSGLKKTENRSSRRIVYSDRSESPRNSARSRSDGASEGYVKRERPPYDNGKSSWNTQDSPKGDTTTSRKATHIEKRLLIHPGTSPYDASVHLNNFIRNGRNARERGVNDSEKPDYLDTAEEILKVAPRESINVAVWNVLLSGFAKERKYQRLFKAFNDMKKRGIRPSSRTYAIMLNNYPSSFDAPAKTLSKATLLFDQAQEHVKQILAQIAEARESEGYELASDQPSSLKSPKLDGSKNGEGSSQSSQALTLDAYTSGNAVAPTNAYLAQMAHFSHLDEVKRVFEAMPKEGPLAPDGKTYTILFEANMAFATKHEHAQKGEWAVVDSPSKLGAQEEVKKQLFDPIALWQEVVYRDSNIRRRLGKRSASGNKSERAGPSLMDEQLVPLIDDRLVVTALRSVMRSSPEHRAYALEAIIPSVYNLSAPGRSAYSASITATTGTMPRFELSERAAETILKLCLASGQTQEGVHYAEQILNMPKIFTDQLLLTHYNAILALFSKANDVDKCLQILDTRPPFLLGESWPRTSWIYALKAARFAGDWEKFMISFKRMTRIPAIADLGKDTTFPAGSIKMDDQILSLLLSTATGSRRVSAMRDSMRILAFYQSGKRPCSSPEDYSEERSTYSQYWRRQLQASAKACLSAIDNAGQDAVSGRNASEEKNWHELVDGLGRLASRNFDAERSRSSKDVSSPSHKTSKAYSSASAGPKSNGKEMLSAASAVLA